MTPEETPEAKKTDTKEDPAIESEAAEQAPDSPPEADGQAPQTPDAPDTEEAADEQAAPDGPDVETLRALEEALLDFPGSAIVILAATLSAHPAIPAIGLVLVLSVDWFIGIARAVGNLVGNCVATVVVAAWEKDIDRARAHDVLNGRIDASDLEAGFAPAPHEAALPTPGASPLPGAAAGR